jgi:hypothetical protein
MKKSSGSKKSGKRGWKPGKAKSVRLDPKTNKNWWRGGKKLI